MINVTRSVIDFYGNMTRLHILTHLGGVIEVTLIKRSASLKSVKEMSTPFRDAQAKSADHCELSSFLTFQLQDFPFRCHQTRSGNPLKGSDNPVGSKC